MKQWIQRAAIILVIGLVAIGCSKTNPTASNDIIPANGPNLTKASATFYQDCNYGGYAVTLTDGSYNLAALTSRGIKNDDVSSVKITSGSVTLYWDDNFSGSTLTLTASNTCLVANGWNDKASSIKVGAGGGGTGTYTYNISGINITIYDQYGVGSSICQSLANNMGNGYSAERRDFTVYGGSTSVKVYITSYTGVAYTSGGVITVGGAYIKGNPSDVGIMTHEGMHIVQGGGNPGWAIEGMADCARYLYCGGALSTGTSYTQGYKVAARFFIWMRNKKGIPLNGLHQNIHNNTLDSYLVSRTGKNADQLWTTEYKGNAAI